MKKQWLLALLLGQATAVYAAQAPDTPVVTGPGFQQVPAGQILVTPPGGSQTTLGAALGAPTGDVSNATATATGSATARTLANWFQNVPGGIGTAAAQNIGTSGANVPLLNGTNTWSSAQTFSGGGTLTGTFAGNPTWSGNHTWSGSTTFNGANTVGNAHSFGFADTGGNRLTMIVTGGNAFQINGVNSSGAARGGVTWTQDSDTSAWTFTVPTAVTYNPVLGATNAPVLSLGNNLSGTYSGSGGSTACVVCVFNATDTAALNSAAQGYPSLMVTRQFGGGSTFGSRFGATFVLTNTGAITGDTSAQQYVGANFWVDGRSNVGGTSTSSSGSKGYLYSMNPQAVLHSGATNWALLNAGGEVDLAVETGASVSDVIGHDIVLLSTNAVAGAGLNIGYYIASQQGAVGTLTMGWGAGGGGNPWPFQSSATILGTIPQQTCGALAQSCQLPAELAAAGVDLQYLNFSQQSGYGFRSAGFAVDGTGQGTFGGGLRLNTASDGYKIDVPNTQVVQSVAVSTAGTPTVSAGSSRGNYYPGDVVYGTGTPTKGQYQVAHTKVMQAVVNAGGTGGTSGTQTVTGTTGTGTKFQASVTISGGAITAVNSISVAGDYTANPTNMNAEPVTGAGLTGATLSIGVGALTVTPLVPDVYAACPGAGGITTTYGSGSGLTLTPTCSALSTINLNPSGGTTKAGGLLQLAGYTVAALPSCAAGTQGAMAYVTDASAPTYNGSLTGGGAVKVPAFCNGSAWTSH